MKSKLFTKIILMVIVLVFLSSYVTINNSYGYSGTKSFISAMKMFYNRQYNRAIALFSIAYKKYEEERKPNKNYLKDVDQAKGIDYRILTIYMAITAEYIGDCYKKLKDRKRALRNYDIGWNGLQTYLNLAQIDPNERKELYQEVYKHLIRIKEKLQFDDEEIPPPENGFRIGPFGGANMSSNKDSHKTANRISGGLGAVFEYFYLFNIPLSEDLDWRWGLEASALYLDGGYETTAASVKYDYLCLNASLKPKFMMNYIVPYLIIGGNFNFNLSSHWTDKKENTGKEYDFRKYQKDYFAIRPGIGMETDVRYWPLPFQGIAYIDFMFEYGLTKSSESTTVYSNSQSQVKFDEGKAMNFMLVIGYKFKL